MKKGFTLIELLAVIVILAIIALIAIPMILHLIEESRLSSTEISMENIENAAKLYYYNKEIDENFKDITFTCNNGVCRNQNETLTLKGNAPEDGKIKINSKGNVTFTPMIMNGYVCVKEGTFKCFKAKTDEIVSEDGIITINETRQYLSNYRIYGNSLQDSVPTPDSPQEIKSVGDLVTDETSPNYGKYEIKIKVLGKNLFKVGTIQDYFGYTSAFQINGDSITGLQIEQAGGFMTYNTYYPYSSNLKYTISFDTSSTLDSGGVRPFIALYDSNKNNISNEMKWGIYNQYYGNGALFVKSQKNLTFEVVNDKIKYIRFGFGLSSSDSSLPVYNWDTSKYDFTKGIVISNIQIEVGDTKTEYEPYTEKVYSIYLDEPLRCAGDVCDYIDFKEGKVVRQVKEFKFKGNDLYWNFWDDSISEKSMGVWLSNNDTLGTYGNPKIQNLKGISNYFVLAKESSHLIQISDSYVGEFAIMANTSPPYIGFRVPFINLKDWKSFLKEKYENGNPVLVYYALKNPIEAEIDLPIISLNENVSNIIVDTLTKPNKLELYYYK